jgi:hypothetical protein
LATQFHGLLDVDGQAVENGVEDATDFARLDQVHVEMIEHLGMTPERVAERRTLLDAGFDVPQYDAECLVVGLALQNVQALDDR